MRSIIVGLDAFDPEFFENLHNQGKTPYLSDLLDKGNYSHFSVSNPAQSEVSWTSIATGLNPGGHGMFDFVHRSPGSYGLRVSLLPTKKTLVGTRFTRPYDAKTIFDHVVDKGYPATALWWPALFPARQDIPATTIPGLGTPDIFGKLGVGTFFGEEAAFLDPEKHKSRLAPLEKTSKDEFTGILFGPPHPNGITSLNILINVLDDLSARVVIGKEKFEVEFGKWSPVIELEFKVNLLLTIKAVTRFILNRDKELSLYFLPLQIHPLASPWPYGTPGSTIKNLWKSHGPFLTLGWPQDTTALEEGFISDQQFLELCSNIIETRASVFFNQMSAFNEGLLAIVFDTLDRIQHMFWNKSPEIIEEWYIKLDSLLGKIVENIDPQEKTKLTIVSDHGFSDFNYKVNINSWLISNGFMGTIPDKENGDLKDVDWPSTQIYALGLNSLYLNESGREKEGTVVEDNKNEIQARLVNQLESWKGPDGNQVIEKVWTREEALSGSLSEWGPDFLIGYARGYRASAETGLGQWKRNLIETNTDHWGADHCINPPLVPGVFFSSCEVDLSNSLSYLDFPSLALGEEFTTKDSSKPTDLFDEDQEQIEERLKGLGYL